MKDNRREIIIVGGVLITLLLAWLGFFLHRSPRFPGSGLGAVFGISGAVLMLAPLGYPIAKRVRAVNTRIVDHVSMKALLTLHVYAGIAGPLLAIVHTGHKFDSWLGIVLTAAMLLVVVSGFVVRYLLTFVSHEIKDKLALLQTARGDLDNAWGAVKSVSDQRETVPGSDVLAAGLASLGFVGDRGAPLGDVSRIAESVADLEYSVRMHEFIKPWFSRCLTLHITVSVFFYIFLALHIGAGVQYGLRWVP